jgi:hypothetical protein
MAFPEEYILESVLLPVTNDHLNYKLTLGESYKWLGINFFMACFQEISDCECWWSQRPVSMYESTPFRLHHVMSLRRYKEIATAMRFTDTPLPTIKTDGFVDRFHEVRNMIDSFNTYYAENNHPS